MTCQHCQTWILDDDHRCGRCGRRVRSTPARISPETYPIAATATAPAYEYDAGYEVAPVARAAADQAAEVSPQSAQRTLFSGPLVDSRVVPFESLITPTGRESIRARAADLPRPAPVKTGKVELRHARPRKNSSADQRRLEFFGQEEVLEPPQSSIICNAPVAPAGLRVRAALIDAAVIAIGCALVIGIFKFAGGEFSLDKHKLPFFIAALLTVPLCYKLLWTFANRDSVGVRGAGLRLVDFDGNPPAQIRRYYRLAGSILSLAAAGVGLIWSLADEDRLTWHDHMSSTFPTLASEE